MSEVLVPTQYRVRVKQMRLFEKDQPGDFVQVDVKFVRVNRQRYFQYRPGRLHAVPRVASVPALEPSQQPRILPRAPRGDAFAIRKLQCDNGKVERSHRIDDEEFWQRRSFATFRRAAVALEACERRYNHERFSIALRGHTPSEVLAAKLSPRINSRQPGSALDEVKHVPPVVRVGQRDQSCSSHATRS